MTLMMGGGSPPIITQVGFRFQKDLGDETNDGDYLTALNQNWNPTIAEISASPFRLRFALNADNAPDPGSDGAQSQFRIHFSLNSNSLGPLTNSSSPIQSATSGVASINHQDETTQHDSITTGDYFEDVGGNGSVIEDAEFTAVMTWDFISPIIDPQDLEILDILEVRPVGRGLKPGDVIEFRVRVQSGGALQGGYVQLPRIVIKSERLAIKGTTLAIKGATLEMK